MRFLYLDQNELSSAELMRILVELPAAADRLEVGLHADTYDIRVGCARQRGLHGGGGGAALGRPLRAAMAERHARAAVLERRGSTRRVAMAERHARAAALEQRGSTRCAAMAERHTRAAVLERRGSTRRVAMAELHARAAVLERASRGLPLPLGGILLIGQAPW
eukprot:1187858-Prorocentrum_minimum.AAC.2